MTKTLTPARVGVFVFVSDFMFRVLKLFRISIFGFRISPSTLPLLNQSRRVLFLVSGDKNPALLERVVASAAEYPASQVAPVGGWLTWLIGQRA